MRQNSCKRKGAPAPAPQYEPHPLANSRAFAFYDFTAAANPFGWHYHPEIELIYWTTARGVRMAGDSIENFENGDLCLIGSNLPHTWSVHILPDRPERNIQVQFLPDCLGRETMGLAEMRPLVQLFEKSRQGLKITGSMRQGLAERLMRIATDKPNPAKRFCLILELLVDLAESADLHPLASSAAIPFFNPRIDRLVSRVLEFVLANLDGDASQAKAAALLGMSPAAFSRFFRRYVGKTYIGCVNEIRIGRACTALAQTDHTVAAIAYDAGFQNLSHFNAQFRKYKRTSPLLYRRLVQRQFVTAGG
jgi:AraC-like DNA-binding protein